MKKLNKASKKTMYEHELSADGPRSKQIPLVDITKCNPYLQNVNKTPHQRLEPHKQEQLVFPRPPKNALQCKRNIIEKIART